MVTAPAQWLLGMWQLWPCETGTALADWLWNVHGCRRCWMRYLREVDYHFLWLRNMWIVLLFQQNTSHFASESCRVIH